MDMLLKQWLKQYKQQKTAKTSIKLTVRYGYQLTSKTTSYERMK